MKKYFRRLATRTVLVPVALLIVGFGSTVPASAAPLTSHPVTTAPRSSVVIRIHIPLPDSLNW
jgi:hypothetical protein